MSDALTLKLKQQLDDRNKAVATPTQRTGASLWESLGTAREPDWISESLDDDGNLLRIAGLGAWAALDVTTLGATGLAARKVLGQEKYEEMTTPETFGERAAMVVGGAAGFLLPMGWARAATGAAVKTFAGSGVKKFTQKYADDAMKIMKGDKDFMAWVGKKVKQGEIEGGQKGITNFL